MFCVVSVWFVLSCVVLCQCVLVGFVMVCVVCAFHFVLCCVVLCCFVCFDLLCFDLRVVVLSCSALFMLCLL